MAFLFTAGKFQAIGEDGPISGALLYTYAAGGLTPLATHPDQGGLSDNTNPVQCDEKGQAAVWLGTAAYRMILKTTAGVTVWDEDNITSPGALTTSNGSAGVGWINSGTGAVARTVQAKLRESVSVLDFGAVGDGVTDDTTAIQVAISAARALHKGVLFPRATSFYLVSSTIVLSSDTVAPVAIFGDSPQWYQNETITVQGNFNGPIFSANGIVSAYCVGPYIGNLTIRNLNTGSNACGVRSDYSGGLRMEWCWIQARNYGIYATVEMISPVFYEVSIDTDAAATNGTGVAGYKIAARNARILGGRVFSQQVALDYIGDSPYVAGTNFEFNQVVFRHGPITSAIFVGIHAETSQILVTNCDTVPINFSGAYVDNASVANAISGCVSFFNSHIVFTNSNSNLAVIKTAGSFVYQLNFDGCFVSATNPIVGSSFAPGTSVALPSGTKVRSVGQTSLTVVVPPSDAFSGFETDSTNGQRYFDKVRVNSLRAGLLQTVAGVANTGTVSQATGNGEFATAVYDVTWRGSGTSYEYGATVRCTQNYNVMTIGTRQSAIGTGSADGHWTLAWTAATGTFVLTNSSGSAKDVTLLVNNVAQLT